MIHKYTQKRGFISTQKVLFRRGPEFPAGSGFVTPKEERVAGRENGRDVEKLEAALKQIGAELNTEIQGILGREGETEVIGKECRIVMEGFSSEQGGPHEAEVVERDIAQVEAKEKLFNPDLENDRVFAHYKQKYKVETEEQVHAAMKRERAGRDGEKLEMALTVLLHRLLKKDFLVMRTAAHDDYEQGVDFLIIDKKTGHVAAAFDGVSDTEGGDRLMAKQERIRRKAESGRGATVHYGLEAEVGENGLELKKQMLENIPTFYLALDKEKLEKLLEVLEYDMEKKPSKAEKNVLKELLRSLNQQIGDLQGMNLSKVLETAVNEFGDSVQRMRNRTK